MSHKPSYSFDELKTVRVPAHRLQDGDYDIKDDKWEETRFGWFRALILQSGELGYKVWIPKSCAAPNAPLTGHKMKKITISNLYEKPYYGSTYALEFIMQPMYDISMDETD
jgi:hypothetical protein